MAKISRLQTLVSFELFPINFLLQLSIFLRRKLHQPRTFLGSEDFFICKLFRREHFSQPQIPQPQIELYSGNQIISAVNFIRSETSPAANFSQSRNISRPRNSSAANFIRRQVFLSCELESAANNCQSRTLLLTNISK